MSTLSRRRLILGLALWVGPALVAAQPVTVRGIAYDSLHARTLSGAFIAIAGTSRTAISDEAGRFVFDSLAPGTYRFVMQHDVLDSIGMSGTATRAIITTGRDTIRVSVPSFGSLWRAACHTPAPADSGMIFGTVRDADGKRPLAGVAVAGRWLDISLDRQNIVSEHPWRLDVRSDSSGGYALCGVPTTTAVRVRATTDSAATGLIELPPLDKTRIQRRDLLLGPADSSTRGTVVGTVTGEAGTPLADARVNAEGLAEVRTGRDGRFVLRGVPVGTQQIDVRTIGLAPVIATVDVVPRDTARVDIVLTKVTMLDSVKITAASIVRQKIVTDFIERRKSGFGNYRDSSELATMSSMSSVLRTMPSTVVRSGLNRSISVLLPGPCVANVFIDGVQMTQAGRRGATPDQSELSFVYPEQIAAMEVYPRAMITPPQFQGRGTGANCGSIVIWTKRIWP